MRPHRRGALRGPLFLSLILIALALSRCGSDGDDRGSAEPRGPVSALVTDVVDGDTIEVELPDGSEEDVRYIGIDTPETVKPGEPVECGGPRAHDVNERLVAGRRVTLRFDAERRDQYDRLLAYVYLPAAETGGRPLFVNAELLRRGLARTLTIAPNDSFADRFARITARAGARGRGLWGRCPLQSMALRGRAMAALVRLGSCKILCYGHAAPGGYCDGSDADATEHGSDRAGVRAGDGARASPA